MYTCYDQTVPDQMSSTFTNRFTLREGGDVTLEEGTITRVLPRSVSRAA